MIRMWILLHNWERCACHFCTKLKAGDRSQASDGGRALDIAVKFKNYVDVVLYYRTRYLEQIGFRENSKKFLAASSTVTIDDAKVKGVIAQEDAKLTGRAGRA